MTDKLIDADLTAAILGAAFAVHSELGPGLLESVYEDCLARELSERDLAIERQRKVPLQYRGRPLGRELRVDMVISGRVIVEVKSTEMILPIHEAQILTYLKMTDLPIGLILNFNTRHLREGIRRMVLTASR